MYGARAAVLGLRAALLALPAALAGCVPEVELSTPAVRAAAEGIRAEAIAGHMAVLADDAMEGREAGTAGYLKAAEYVASRFRELGLEGAGGDGGYFQRVPLRTSRPVPEGGLLVLERDEEARPLTRGVHYLLRADLLREETELSAPLSYVGFGVVAPRLGYDDYAGVDVRGKVIVMFSGAPASFPHNERAYFASSRVKMSNAVERGAVGLISMLLPSKRRRSPWERSVRNSTMARMRWIDETGRPHDVFPGIRVSARLGPEGMEALFEGSPVALVDVIAAAERGRPRPFDLPVRVRARAVSRLGSTESPNVAAVLRGADPILKDQYVVFTAHLDHLGVGEPVDGDPIHNGAYDNASGVAMLLEVARAFRSMPAPPRRSLLFLAVTAEEKGLLGSDYFAHHPTVPMDAVVADINLDMALMLHPLVDVIAFGAEHSSLARPMARAARRLGLRLSPDPVPEEVLFIRSDQYSFVRQGVPSLFVVSGWDPGDSGGEPGELEEAWLRDTYHSPGDDMSQEIDFEAGALFARANFLVGHVVANQTEPPRWKRGDFFGELFGRDRR
ncbi:MAG: M28 family metallopeptidase [Acidobacteriota bacterium]